MAAVTFWAAVLLTYGVSTGIAMVPSGSSQGQGRYAKVSKGSSKVPSRYQKASRASLPVASGSSNIPSASWQAPSGAGSSAGANKILKLDMAPNSVDDMYQGCKDKMYQKLQEYLANEKNTNPTFKRAWESSEQWYNNFKRSKPALGKDRLVAIYCYTFKDNKVYLDFNTAVRTQAPQYKTTFGYHALHFLLTDAIQTLKGEEKLPEGEDGCVTVYRRVDTTFDQVVNTQLRFGSFTSTSMGQYANKYFGDKTYFEIYTCFGADVSMYSPYPEEREVLIPPYEVFKVDPAKAVAGSSAGADDILKLDMAPNSVDDMYQGCKDKMYQKLQELLAYEKNTNAKFKATWESSEQWYNKEFKKSKPALGKDRLVAIYYYTFGRDNAYLDFNNAVRTQKNEYTTTFGYHALHFLLTDAIQTLKERRLSNLAPGEDGCVTGYRRVDKTFDQVVNTQLRFGSFTSTSKDQYSNKVERFGDKTCFEIYTCFGVDVSMYSKFENEGEVLIPPYEVFKVEGVKKSSMHKDLPCEVEYKLRSTGIGRRRNLNCDLFKKKRNCKICNLFKCCIG
ncbi:hypothetical protein ABVT39_007105 [Epinephelus coioides]